MLVPMDLHPKAPFPPLGHLCAAGQPVKRACGRAPGTFQGPGLETVAYAIMLIHYWLEVVTESILFKGSWDWGSLQVCP